MVESRCSALRWVERGGMKRGFSGSMSAADPSVAEAEALALSLDAVIPDRTLLGATIRPMDYLSGEAVPSIPTTRGGDLPSITLNEPTLVEHAGHEAAALEVVRTLGEGGMGRVLLAKQ